MSKGRTLLLRKSYINKHGHRVKAVYKKIIKRKGVLRKYGYKLALAKSSRRSALRKAVKRYGSVPIIRRLNALAILRRKKDPSNYHKLRSDMHYVQERRKRKSKSH